MSIIDNILCVSGSDIIISEGNPYGLIPLNTYKSLKRRKQINVLDRACRNNPAQIEYDSLPLKLRQMYEERFGDPRKRAIQRPIVGTIKADPEALAFYSLYELSSGETLLEVKNSPVKEYCNNAAVLNAVKDYIAIRKTKRAQRRSLGMTTTDLWTRVAEIIHDNEIHKNFPHTLPTNPTSLQRRYNVVTNDI